MNIDIHRNSAEQAHFHDDIHADDLSHSHFPWCRRHHTIYIHMYIYSLYMCLFLSCLFDSCPLDFIKGLNLTRNCIIATSS